MPDTTTIDETIASLVTEASDLLKRLDRFAWRAHLITGPLFRDVMLTEARWPGAGDRVTDEFYAAHPAYDTLHSLCWELESRALAALTDRSELTATDWVRVFHESVDDLILMDEKVSEERKAEILTRRERRARMDRHGRNIKEDPNYNAALTLAHQHINQRSTLDEFRMAATADGYSPDTVDRVIDHLGLHEG